MDPQAVFQANRISTARLRRFAESLPVEALRLPVTEEWSVKLALAHLAFWDWRVIYVIESARKNRELHAPSFDDQLNDILAPLFDLIPAPDVRAFVLEVSQMLDGLLEDCPGDLLAEMEKRNIRLVDRSIHRNAHLDEMEKAIRNRQ
jgi:hypothetical protein